MFRFALPRLLLPSLVRRSLQHSHRVTLPPVLLLHLSHSASFQSSSMSQCILSSVSTSPPLTYPSIFPPHFSNMPSSFPDPPLSVPSTEASNIPRPSHSCNLHSLEKSSSLDVCGIGIIPRPKLSKATRGRHSTISKAIHQVGIDVVEGRPLSIDWVLRA